MTTVYLDTSVAINESFLQSPYCEAFFKACGILQISVVIPEVVLDELKGNFPKKLQEKYAPYQKAKKDLGKLIDLVDSTLTLPEVISSYYQWLDVIIKNYGVSVAQYPDVSAKELIEQSYGIKKPFKPSGEGYKDYLIWKTILAHIEKSQSPPNIFLTNNTKDFCESHENDTGILHPDLANQIDNIAYRPMIYTAMKGAFDAVLSPHLEGITLDDIPDLGPDDIDIMVGRLLLEDLPSRSLYALEGVPFSNEISVSSIGQHSIDSVALKRVHDEVIIRVTGQLDVEVDGFIDKSDYYGMESQEHNMYVVDGSWNDHVMAVSSTVDISFEMTIFYSLQNAEVTGSEITLPQEIEDEWPYK